MGALAGRRIAVLEGRMRVELAGLVRRQGGVPCSVPAVHEIPLDCSQEVSRLLDGLERSQIDLAIFLTGAGVRALCAEVEHLSRLPALISGLTRITIACRGPKPAAALAQIGVPVTVRAGEPFTSTELLAALSERGLDRQAVILVHYGERDGKLAESLRSRGARVDELCLYEWRLPDDLAPLRTLVAEIVAGRMDAVAFTSQVQARHLFAVAAQMGLTDRLRDALNHSTVVASLAPTCLGALRALGVEPHVVPEHSKSGHLIVALARHFNPATADHELNNQEK
jgi:uroporphyrinogen-III synthase